MFWHPILLRCGGKLCWAAPVLQNAEENRGKRNTSTGVPVELEEVADFGCCRLLLCNVLLYTVAWHWVARCIGAISAFLCADFAFAVGEGGLRPAARAFLARVVLPHFNNQEVF